MAEKSDFYGEIGQEKYLNMVRNFVPRYDVMIETLADLIIKFNPSNILDIGSGVGNIDYQILSSLEKTEITCVEASKQMADATKSKLKSYSSRVDVVNKKIQDFQFGKNYDLVFSNLTIHNIPFNEKQDTLEKIYNSMNIGAPFVWGDLVRYGSLRQEILVAARHLMAIARGSSPKFSFEDWKKEKYEDSKLSINETLDLCRKVGFKDTKIIWKSQIGTTAIFYMTR